MLCDSTIRLKFHVAVNVSKATSFNIAPTEEASSPTQKEADAGLMQLEVAETVGNNESSVIDRSEMEGGDRKTEAVGTASSSTE